MDIPSKIFSLLACAAFFGSATLATAAVPEINASANLPAVEDVPRTITYAQLVAATNASDADSPGLTIRLVSQPGNRLRNSANTTVIPNGALLSNGDTWKWTALADVNGPAVEGFVVEAFAGAQSSANTCAVTFNVAPVNDAPNFSGATVPVAEDSTTYETPQPWATNISFGPANESGQAVDRFEVVTVVDPSLFSVQPSVDTQGRLSFTLAPNANGSSKIFVNMYDNGGTTNGGVEDTGLRDYTITVTPVPDDPEVAVTFAKTAANPFLDGSGGEAVTPPAPVFSAVSVIDPDHANPVPDLLTVEISVPNDPSPQGIFTFPPGYNMAPGPNSTFVYTRNSRTPAQAQADLAAITFQPTANVRPVGDHDFDLTVKVTDSTARTDTQTGKIFVKSVNDLPAVNASLSPTEVQDNSEVSPFRLSVSDPDLDETFSVTIVSSGTSRGTLIAPTGGFPITGTAAEVAAKIRNVRFVADPQSATVSANFVVGVTDVHPGGSTGASVDTNLALSVVFVNDPTEFAGLATEIIRMTDDPNGAPVNPFSGISLVDADSAQQLTLSLLLDNQAKGSFKIDTAPTAGQLLDAAGANLAGTSPIWGVKGTAAEITAILRNLIFVPNPDRIPVNTSETITITLNVDDGISIHSNSQTQIEVTSVNGAPRLLWNPAGPNAGNFPDAGNPAKIDPAGGAKPFAAVEIADEGEVAVTVSLDDSAKGELVYETGYVGDKFTLTNPGQPGIYSFSGSPAAVRIALQALVFVPSQTFLFPPGQPGRTDFAILASDSAQSETSRVLPIVLLSAARNFLVTSAVDDVAVVGSLRHAIANAKNDDVITFALPSYPATIRLAPGSGPMVINKHLTFRGPGADRLTISGDSNASGTTDSSDEQLFRIFATVTMQGVKLSRGFGNGGTGGAIYVGRLNPASAVGSLTLLDCTVSNCLASRWGGAIDVEEGRLIVKRCLFEGNSLNASSGQGGGAISLYTNELCAITNTTFSGNSQPSTNGIGGGAVYVENHTANRLFKTEITHCTFAENIDLSAKGSAIHNNVANSRVSLTNNIFNDFSNRNLMSVGGGEIVSTGGNISDDNTSTTFIQGGVPQQAILLNAATDQRTTDAKLAPIGPLESRTRGYRLLPASPAIATALGGISTLDQRGIIRDGSSDVGAVDASALDKLLIHEIFALKVVTVAPAPPSPPQFIEFFNPRDVGPIDIGGYEVWINGKLRHVFAGPEVIQPGFRIVLSDAALPTAPASARIIFPPAVPLPAVSTPLGLTERSIVELRAPSVYGTRTVSEVSYIAVFADPANPAISLNFDNNALTLAPQFQGAAFVPHKLVQAPPNGGTDLAGNGDQVSPGANTGGTPFGAPNAFPIAIADNFEFTEDEILQLPVLANDFDADGSDEIFVVDLNSAISAVPPLTNQATALTAGGAHIAIFPAGSPLRGTSVTIDPRARYNSLPEGARVTDSFAYSIIDVGGGAVTGYADDGAGGTWVSAPFHRLAVNDVVIITGSPVFNGSHVVSAVEASRFSIPIPSPAVLPGPAEFGKWQGAVPRTPTERDEALVQISIRGVNDAPLPVDDQVFTNEETVLRIFADPDLAGVGMAFDTDSLYPAPRQFAATAMLSNDLDPDTDDNPFTKLHVIGVTKATMIGGYSAAIGSGNVRVSSPAHGLANGSTVLISGYGGNSSYNGYHLIAVAGDADSFELPIPFKDDHAQKGLWTVLNDGNRFSTTSSLGASVTLDIRANRIQTNAVYNPRPSAYLDGLAFGETETDTFYYAVEDTHGAVSLAKVSVDVSGVNDAPIPVNDPPSLANINPIFVGGLPLPQFFAGSDVLFEVPSSTGQPDTTDVAVRPPGGDDEDIAVIGGIRRTDEDSPISLASADLLSNDSDVDRSDVASIEIIGIQNKSRSGADISLAGGGSIVVYDPRFAVGPTGLQALSEGERVVDTFEITVFDGIARVNSLVAVLVEGRNDQPIATNITLTTPENQLLAPAAPGLLVAGTEIDQNVKLPDDRKFLFPANDLPTMVVGAKVNVALQQRFGNISAIAGVSGNPAATRLSSPAHGLQTGEEIVVLNSGALTGQYPVTRIDADAFSVNQTFLPTFSGLSGGNWKVLASDFQYDPRGSVFDGLAGPAFTLQGLAVGQTFSDTYEYSLLDGSFLFANDDIFRIEADRSDIELRVLLNDTNLEGISTSRRVIAVSKPTAGGTVAINNEESLIYTPQTGFIGDEIMVYTIEDEIGNRATAKATARVTIDRLNGNLRANPDRFTVAKGQAPLLDVIANDAIIPATGNPLELTGIATAPDQGGQAQVEAGKIRFTPDAVATVFPYTETFSYTISGGGSASATATATVLVLDRSNQLNLRNDSFSVPSGSTDILLNVLANDNVLPGNGDALTVESVTAASNGTVTVFNGIAVSYTPNPGYLGPDFFTYFASNGLGGGGSATVQLQVGYLTTNNDFFSVGYDNPAKVLDDGPTNLDVLANDNVLQSGGGDVTITAVTPTNTSLGVMSIAAGGTSLDFNPAEGETGQQDYIYTITDAGGRTAIGSVTVVVLVDGIRASSDFYTVQTGSEENELNVLSNDAQLTANGGALTVIAIGTGANAPAQGGTAVISPDSKKIIYAPASGFRGVESFTYTVTDGTSTDTASVSVRSTIGALAAGDDSFLVYHGSENNRLGVLGNDRVIPDTGQLLTITAVGLDSANALNPPNRGTLEIIEAGNALRYTPSPANIALNYVETFTYEISSGGTSRSEARISIEVLDRVGVRNLETNPDVFSVRSDSAGAFLSVLANDGVMPASASDWFITGVTPPTANVCSPFLTGDFANPDVFAAKLVAAADPLSAFLWMRFSPASQAVLASPASTALQLQVVLVNELNALVTSGSTIHNAARFTGVALRPETQALVTNGASGEQLLVLNRLLLEDGFPTDIRQATSGGNLQIINNEVFFAPRQGFVGIQRFTYRVSDGIGGTGSAEVIVKVGDISVSDDRFTLLSDSGPVLLNVTANDGILRTPFPTTSDPAQADFTLSQTAAMSVSPPTAGIAVASGEMVRFTPSGTFSGSAVLTYQVDDDSGCRFPGIAHLDIRAPGGDRDKAMVTINVTGVNDEPFMLNADPNATNDETAVNPFANATVIEYDDQRAQEVVIRVNYPHGNGTLSGSFTEISPGILEFRGTAAQITAALRALVYTPFRNRITVGATEDTLFSVSLDDGFVTSPVIIDSVVTTVTPVNQPPILTGMISGQKLYQYSTLRPFVGVNIVEIDDLTLQPQTVKVKIDDPMKGRLLNLGGFTEQPAGSGEYEIRGIATDTSAALRQLVFEPTPGNRVTSIAPETVRFTICVDDGFAPQVIDPATTVIVSHGEIDRLLPLNGSGQDFSQAGAAFGTSVAVSGNTMIIGSPLRDTPNDSGSVFIYERDAGSGAPWGQVAEIKGSNATAGDRFGYSVSIDGDFIVVGAPQDVVGVSPLRTNPKSGLVYVFQRDPANRNAWIEVAKLLPPVTNARGGDAFGAAVAIEDLSILVGAPNADIGGLTFSGKAFQFTRDSGNPGSWAHTQTLVGSENLAINQTFDGEYFGAAIAFDGNTAIIGAYGANKSYAPGNFDLGAAYVFVRSTQNNPWTEVKKLHNFDDTESRTSDSFGFSVDVSGDRIVVGSFPPGLGNNGYRKNSVRIYERDSGGAGNWGKTTTIVASDNAISSNFAASVSISENLLMIGSPGPSAEINEARGFVELYRWNSSTTPMWKMIDRFSPGSAAAQDGFGKAVALDRFIGVVGANTDSVNQLSAASGGSARVYQFQYDSGPRLAIPVPNLIAVENTAFSFAVDSSAFGDPNYSSFTISAQLQSGGALAPGGWLSFDPGTRVFSGTPTASNKTPYSLVLVATNPMGTRMFSNNFTVSTDPAGALQAAYASWSSARFGAAVTGNPALEATTWGMHANPDGDENDNLLESLFGLNPNSPDIPVIKFTKINASQVSLEFSRSLDYPSGAYHVEWSTGLGAWSRTGVALNEVPGTPGFADVTAILTLSAPETKLFVRVTVEN